MKAIGYIRVSTEEQAKEGISLAHQKAKIKAYADLHDIELISIVEDRGLSAKSINKRPGATWLVGKELAAETIKFDAIIVYKLDRLFRNAAEALEVAERCNRSGVSLHSVTEKLDTHSAMGRFFFAITAAYAEMERNLISERTRDALRHKKTSGEVYNHVPYGYQEKNGKLVAEPEEQSIIQCIKVWRGPKHSLTLQAIADRLNKEGVPTKKGGRWHAQSVKQVLSLNP